MFTLSAGEYQKAQLCLPWLMDSRIILLDEPLANLDPVSRAELAHAFTELAENRIILISTHHLDEVMQSDKEILLIDTKGTLRHIKSEVLRSQASMKSLYR